MGSNEVSSDDTFLFFVFLFSLLIHFADVIVGRLSGTVTVLEYVFWTAASLLPVCVAYFNNAFKDRRNEVVGAGVISALVPWLNWLLPKLAAVVPFGQTIVLWLNIFLIFAPVFTIYIGLRGGAKLNSAAVIYLMVWLVLLIVSAYPAFEKGVGFQTLQNKIPFTGLYPGYVIQQGYTAVVDGWTRLVSGARQSVSDASAAWDETRQLALYGDIYTAKVEAQKDPVGVFLDSVQATEESVQVGKPISIVGTVRAETVGKPLTVQMSCSCCDSGASDTSKTSSVFSCGDGISGDACSIRPKSTLLVSSKERKDIYCKFPTAASATAGSPTLGMKASFDFTTFSSLKTYFMDANRVRASRQSDIDPLTQYGVEDKNPSSITTPGPINMGLGLSENPPPILIDNQDNEKLLTLGITVQNVWSGVIDKVTGLTVGIPEGFTITDVNQEPYKEQCAQDKQELLCPLSLTAFKTQGVHQGFQVRVYLSAGKDARKLLGDQPVGVRFFSAKLDYAYSLVSQTSVRVTEAPKQSVT